MTREEIVAELGQIGEALRAVTALYERRIALWKAARELDPPMTHKELAEASGITDIAVSLGFRKSRQQEAERQATPRAATKSRAKA